MAVGTVLTTFAMPASGANGVAHDGSNLLVACGAFSSEGVYKINPDTGAQVAFLDTARNNLRGLAWDGVNPRVCAQDSPGYITKISPSSGSTVSELRSPSTQPRGLTWDGSYLWHADGDANKVYRLNPSTGAVVSSFTMPTGLWGLAWAAGSLWALTFDDRLIKLSTTGTILQSITLPFTDGTGLGADTQGQCFWVSRNSNQITKLEGPNFNTGPDAPSLTGPATGTILDRAVAQRFSWIFSDPNPGDSQSKFDLRYRLTGTATWTTVTSAVPNTFWDASAGLFAAGDYEWQARTYDAQGVVGPYSASSFFTAADAPPMPTITAPVSGGTVGSTETVTWSTPNQAAYQVRRVADNAGSPNAGTVYYDSGEIASNTARSAPLTFDANNRYEHIQVRIKLNGLWSQWASIRVLVSYTPPAAATGALTPDAPTGSLLVTITNPAPGAGEPAAAYNTVEVDDGDGLGFSTRYGSAMLPTNTPWRYMLPRSGRDYAGAVKIITVADNGTTAETII